MRSIPANNQFSLAFETYPISIKPWKVTAKKKNQTMSDGTFWNNRQKETQEKKKKIKNWSGKVETGSWK